MKARSAVFRLTLFYIIAYYYYRNLVCYTVLVQISIGRLPAFSLFPQSSEDKTLLPGGT